jgi:anti-anti-sigma regulatory factor
MHKEPIMLRVETREIGGALVCSLEGRFTGEGAEHVRLLVTRCDSKLELVFDLTEVMFIDAVGEDVLLLIKKLGGEFVAETAYARDICERLQLPLVRNHKQNSELQGNTNGKGYPSPTNSRRL